MLIELLRRASVGKRSSRKVCRALPDGQIQPLDERRVQCRGVLGVIERVIKSPRGSVQRSPFDLDDAIVPARFEDLAVEARWPEEATDDLLGCLRCLLLMMWTYPVAKESLTLYLARSEGHERYFGCNLMHRKVLASSHQHLMAEAPDEWFRAVPLAQREKLDRRQITFLLDIFDLISEYA